VKLHITPAALPFSLLFCLMFASGACDRAPWLPLPTQSPSFDGPIHAARVVDMSDPDADRRILRDIAPRGDTSWRWSQQRPALRIRVRANENLKYTIDFALPAITFKDTGPVTIAFTVNDRVLDRVRYTTADSHHFEKSVPQDWLPIDADAIVGAEIDKLWTSKIDGRTFGVIIVRMGLMQ
jgi:hypothetical protein